jgi:hypothetical protein
MDVDEHFFFASCFRDTPQGCFGEGRIVWTKGNVDQVA